MNFKYFYLIVGFIICAGTVIAQEETMQMSEEQKAWMEYMTPGEMHKMMAKMTGEWKAEMTMWMSPGSESVNSTGNAVSEMILGGRYMQTKYQSEFMGMPMNGISIEGFDNKTREFNSLWIDNMGTGFMISKGNYFPEEKMIKYNGSFIDPLTGKDIPVRTIVKFEDDNNFSFEMFMSFEGQEFKSMEIKYTR
ncbi:MAG: hypothetical protein Kow0098_24610 [Ignavibacteriaceae bacterium]